MAMLILGLLSLAVAFPFGDAFFPNQRTLVSTARLISNMEVIEKPEIQTTPKPNANETLDAFSCPATCVGNLSETANHTSMNKSIKDWSIEIEELNIEISLPESVSEDPEALDKWCKDYRKRRDCIDSCPDSLSRRLINKGLIIFNFVCIEKIDAYKKHMPCIRHVDSVSNVSRCHEIPEAASADNSTAPVVSNSSGIESVRITNSSYILILDYILNTTCQRLHEYSDCIRHDVTKECGSEAMALLNDQTAVAVNWLLDLAKFFANRVTGEELSTPEVCAKFVKSKSKSQNQAAANETLNN